MTVLCGGGTSAPKPGVATNNVIAGALIDAGLLAISPWLAPAAALIDGFIFEATTQCTSDPPAMPTFDATDVEALALGMLSPNWDTFANKVNDALLNWAWYRFCQCTSGSTPPIPVVVSPPGVGGGTSSTPSPCWTYTLTDTPIIYSSAPTYGQTPDLTTTVLPPYGTGVNLTDVNGLTFRIHQIYPGAVSIQYNTTYCHSTLNGYVQSGGPGEIVFFNSSHAVIESDGFYGQTGQSYPNFSGTIPIPATAAYYLFQEAWAATTAGTIDQPEVIQLTLNCSGSGPGSLSGCCPPDPSIILALNNLTQLVNSIIESLPAPITSYADGTSHAGLSGSGTVTLGAGAIAYRVNITTIPAHYGSTMGSPPYYFDLGWVTPGALSEPFAQQRVALNGQVFPLPAAATEIFYTLNAGVVITVTELTRGP